jgi:methanogenic corrinoid protein MtbC1
MHAFDVAAAEALVYRALEEGLTSAEVCSQVIAPAMTTAGDAHLATGVAYRALDVVAAAARTGATPRSERILLASADDEERRHPLGLHMVATVLEGAGFEVLCPPSRLPTKVLRSLVSTQRPNVVGLAATRDTGNGRLHDAIHAVRETAPDVGLLVVGDVEDAVDAVEGLLAR